MPHNNTTYNLEMKNRKANKNMWIGKLRNTQNTKGI